MELYAAILMTALLKHLESQNIDILSPDLNVIPAELVERKSYAALCKIKTIIEDESLDDPQCFQKIEEIVRVLEELGSDGGPRHDFG